MNDPIRIEDNGTAGYVHYTREPIVGTIDVWCDGAVAADVDAGGGIVGIEVLGFDAELIEHARAFAASKGLTFPVDIREAS